MTTSTRQCCGTTKRMTRCKRTISAERLARGETWCGTCQAPASYHPQAGDVATTNCDVLAAAGATATEQQHLSAAGSCGDFLFDDAARSAISRSESEVAQLAAEHHAASRKLIDALDVADDAFSRHVESEYRRAHSSYLRKHKHFDLPKTRWLTGHKAGRGLLGSVGDYRRDLPEVETLLFYDGLSLTASYDVSACVDLVSTNRRFASKTLYAEGCSDHRLRSLAVARLTVSDFTAGNAAAFAACDLAQRYLTVPKSGTTDIVGLRVAEGDESTVDRLQVLRNSTDSNTTHDGGAVTRGMSKQRARRLVTHDTSRLLLHPTMLAPVVDAVTGHVDVSHQPESGVAAAVSVSGLSAWLSTARDVHASDDNSYVRLSCDQHSAAATMTLMPIHTPDASETLRLPVSVASASAVGDPDLFVPSHVISDAVADADARGSDVITFAWDGSQTSDAARSARASQVDTKHYGDLRHPKPNGKVKSYLFQGALYVDCDASSARSARGVTVMCDAAPHFNDAPRRDRNRRSHFADDVWDARYDAYEFERLTAYAIAELFEDEQHRHSDSADLKVSAR